ncbi:MAG: DUF4294 domain-containing protein [Prevotellaceae bacterium]|jgi:hypothetical protein|nr:DUF4294 domain-containing protein [Prevotellaceae bacterium]
MARILSIVTLLLLLASAASEAKAEFLTPSDTIFLSPLYIYSYRSRKDYKKYRRIVYNLKKVYPYAQTAKRKLNELEMKYRATPSDRDRKKIVGQLEKELFAEFDAPLRKLTVSQGRMLIKLIDRETGMSSYSLLKEFKGGFSAAVWQGVAVVFGHNLKSRYDRDEDKMLEELVLMCEKGTFDKLYYSMFYQ